MSIIDPSAGSWVLSKESNSLSKVGKDELAWCSNCKMNLRHTIITVDSNNAPYRVQCKTCKTERKYRPPKDEGKNGNTLSSGGKMNDHDEDHPIYQEELAKKEIFGEDDSKRKKARPKAKAKPKKAKGDSGSIARGAMSGAISAEDKKLFENKLSAFNAANGSAKEYAMGPQKFAVGDVINHQKFGFGFVVSESGINKIDVLFGDGKRVLVHGIVR